MQIRVIAFDDANRESTAEAIVTITVTRNRYFPQFSSKEYRTSMLEIAHVGTSVATVTASDRDEVSLSQKSSMHFNYFY